MWKEQILNDIEKYSGNLTNIKLKTPNSLNCSEELAKSLLIYIYWKYKNPKLNLKGKYNMANIRDAVGLDKIKIEKLIEPITFNRKCYICNKNAIVSIPSYDRKRIIFECKDCGHFYETAPASNYEANEHFGVPYVKCNCKHCSSIKDRIFKRGVEWFNNLRVICEELTQSNNKIINLPDNETMKHHYTIYFNKEHNKNLIEIMNYKPSTLNELMIYVNEISLTKYPQKDEYKKLLILKLKENNILYEVKKQKDVSAETLLMSYVFGKYNKVLKISEFEQLSNYMLNGDFINNYQFTKYKNDSDVRYVTQCEKEYVACINFDIINQINMQFLYR